LLVPVEDPAHQARLVSILETCMQDNVKARQLLPDGHFERVKATSRSKEIRSQEVFYREACEAAHQAQTNRYMAFEPQLPGGTTPAR
jgi:polyphosphate kinase